ncbi:7265_t:CDS:2 [Racocetra persica]|uniref:7265_t:CDS:1 n=1 Tax=Racocetra persica TaxID=160502 RepID=A0ACA9M2R7_9GLOM|nr:7265_t:CDS:2 [Racocetra persica]
MALFLMSSQAKKADTWIEMMIAKNIHEIVFAEISESPFQATCTTKKVYNDKCKLIRFGHDSKNKMLDELIEKKCTYLSDWKNLCNDICKTELLLFQAYKTSEMLLSKIFGFSICGTHIKPYYLKMSNLLSFNNDTISLIEKTIKDLNVTFYDIKQFKNSELIGRGAFANVYRAKLEDPNSNINDVALKVFTKGDNDNESINALAREIELHMRVDMNNRIIKFYGITKREVTLFEPGHNYVLVLELANSRTLRNYLQNNVNLNWYNRLRLA